MSTVESLAQNTAGQRQLRLMVALTELEPLDSLRQVNIDPLYENVARWGLEKLAIDSDLDVLKANGWIEFSPDFEGIGNVTVSQSGVDAAEAFKSLRSNPRRRVQEIRDAVLNWLYNQHLSGGEPSGISEFLASSYNQHFGDPYSEDELARATQWLLDEEYVEGTKTFGVELALPTITTKGMRIVETEQSVSGALTSADMTVNEVNISGSQGVNVAVASSNVAQTNTMTQEQTEKIEQILESVRAMLNPTVIGVTEKTTAEAQAVAMQVQNETQSSAPDAGKVKALLQKLMVLAATGTVQGGVTALTMMMQQGISGL